MAKFRQRTNLIEAVQLLWTTWNEMCAFTQVGDFRDGKPEGCYVDVDGKITDDANGRIGLKIPGQVELATEGDWIVNEGCGVFAAYSPAAFEAIFEPAYQMNADTSAFEPLWAKYPKLSAIFAHRPPENIYWVELRELLADARADAVRFVHDVRADELAKAREEGRRSR